MKVRNKKNLLGLFFLLVVLPTVVFASLKIQNIYQNASSISGDITIDFSNRANTSHRINNHFAGMNGFDKIMGNNQILGYLASSNFNLMRVSVDMVNTFPSSSQQNWGPFDNMMSIIASQNLHPILTIGYTPTWLQPNPNPCGSGNSHVAPGDVQGWGQVAASVVAHMDQKFPTVHPEYELWNEPDGTTFMCVSPSDPNPDQTRLTEYKQIYAAAAPLMKQQAQKDGVTIHVGGPALAVPKARASLWFPALVSDPTVAPYLDFITYHDYQNSGAPGDSWTTFLAGTQDPKLGQAAIFEQISKYVRAGIQPNATQTPIYEDEYNTNTGSPNCCRNDLTYSPLWNSLIIADLLNTVNDTQSPYGPAQQAPAGFAYFVSTQPPPRNQFCVFGTWNSAMDCTAGNQPYPQYYAYQLFTDPRYLDITNQGYVATAANTTKPGLVVTAFYTQTKDNVVIVNTSGTAYTNLIVAIQNPGNTSATTATVFTLNQANPQITTAQTPVQQSGNGYTGLVNVPAYTTVALSISATGSGGGTIPPPTNTPTPTTAITITPSMTPPQPSGATNTPTSTPTPFPTGTTGNLIIFDSALQNGFTNHSFGYASQSPCDTSTFIIPPCSYAVSFNGDGALDFRTPNGGMDIESYNSLSLYINTGNLPISDFSAVITSNRRIQNERHEVQLSSSNIVAIFGGGWQQIMVPLAKLDPKDTKAVSIEVRNFASQPLQQTIHIQNVQLLQ